MDSNQNRSSKESLNFRQLVKECAAEPQIVACFNQAHGADLRAPIAALLDDRYPFNVSDEETVEIGHFIGFVHDQIWLRAQVALARLGDLAVRETGIGI